MTRLLYFCIYLFLLLQCCCAIFEERPTYGYHLRIGVPNAFRIKAAESFRIVGGSAVNRPDVIPYQAGIITTLTTGHTSLCGGSLISDTRVLTAAHCWWDGQSQARQFTVVLGSLTIFSGGTRTATTDVRVHPQWTVNMIHDIAVAVVAKVTLTNNIQLIALPTVAEGNLNFIGTSGVISGFGKTSDAQTSFPASTSLHQTTVSIISNAVCQTSFPVQIHGSHVCVSGQGGKGTCDGDSGGPLAVVNNNRKILVGVVSFGPNEGCQANKPSVFTRVASYLSWIQTLL